MPNILSVVYFKAHYFSLFLVCFCLFFIILALCVALFPHYSLLCKTHDHSAPFLLNKIALTPPFSQLEYDLSAFCRKITCSLETSEDANEINHTPQIDSLCIIGDMISCFIVMRYSFQLF